MLVMTRTSKTVYTRDGGGYIRERRGKGSRMNLGMKFRVHSVFL